MRTEGMTTMRDETTKTRSRRVRPAVLLAAIAFAAACGNESSGPPRLCNGHAELCDRPFDQVAFAGAHNAMSNSDDGWLLPNQEHDLENQLDQGVRVFLIDTHDWQGSTWLCHEYCEQIGRAHV